MTDLVFLYLNAAVAASICLRLVFYRRDGGTHKAGVSWIAWLLVVASGVVALRAILDTEPPTADPAELGINIALMVAVFRARGNLARLFRVSQPDEENDHAE